MKIPLLIGLSGIIGAVLAAQVTSADALLSKHVKQMQAAPAFQAQFTVQQVGDGPVEYKVKFEKDGKFRFESPDELIVANGTTVSTLKKSDNTYWQTDQTPDDLKKFLKKDAVLAWTAFFLKEPFKDTTEQKVGASRVMKGKAITEVSLVLPGKPERTATLFIDQTLGIARGASIETADKKIIVIAKDLTIGADVATDSDFAFTAPDGAKKVDPSAVASVTFDKVAPIFNTNCAGCHGATGGRAGLDLSSYAGTMAGGRRGAVVVAGDPDNSPIMGNLKGTKKLMPPGGALAQSDIDTIAAWIKSGAKEK